MFDVKGREFRAVVLGWPITNAFLPSVHDGFESVCHGRSLSGSLFVHHSYPVERVAVQCDKYSSPGSLLLG